jgi:glucose/arabinose dehydrogenase
MAGSETRYRVRERVSGLSAPWRLAFLPDGGILISEKFGGLQRFKDGTLTPVAGVPAAFAKGDGGLLDVVLDPEFAVNRRVFLAYVEGAEGANRVTVLRAVFDGAALSETTIIFRNATDKSGASHPGGRITFLPDQTLLLTLGEGYDFKEQAQDPASGLGKIVRLTRDGAPPADNPSIAGGMAGLYSLGHRNVQGLHYDAGTDTIWSHEHGPRGGDEINVIAAGHNYGWPGTTFGIDYDGEQISKAQTAEGVTVYVLTDDKNGRLIRIEPA